MPLEAASDALARVRAQRVAEWQSLVGPLLAEMLKTREDAYRHLSNAEDNVRIVALELISSHWGSKPGDDFSRLCEKMALDDPSINVRLAAISALGRCYADTDDVRIGKLLAQLVHDASMPLSCRRSAYRELFFLRGSPIEAWPSSQAGGSLKLRIPDEVDWAFVDSFLVEGRSPHPSPSTIDSRIDLLPDPLRAAARSYRDGLAAFESGDVQRSLELFSQSISANPDLTGPYTMRGRVNLQMGNLDAAIHDFNKAIDLRPRSADALRFRGEAYARKGQAELAESDRRAADEIERE
ncbi:MAG: tetratricopeptide repeat protein [Thermoguttaceae bacterium]